VSAHTVTSPFKRASDMKFSAILAAHAEGRPATAAAIREAIEEARAVLPAATAEAEEIEKQRRKVLLTASDEELEKAEKQVAERRRTAERLEVALETLSQLLAAAEDNELVTQVQVLAEDYRQKQAALDATWKRSYPAALATVRKLIAMEEEAERAFRAWDLSRQRMVKAHPERGEALPEAEGFPSKTLGFTRLSEMLHMPDATGRLCTTESIRPLRGGLAQQSHLERLEGLEEARRAAEKSKADFDAMMSKREERLNQPPVKGGW
jgi:hypothetical protein